MAGSCNKTGHRPEVESINRSQNELPEKKKIGGREREDIYRRELQELLSRQAVIF